MVQRGRLARTVGVALLCGIAAARPSSSSDAGEPLSAAEIRAMTDAGNNAEAVEAARLLLADADARYGSRSLPVAEALDLLARALARAHAGEIEGKAERLALAERALEIRLELQDASEPEVARAYYVVGLVHSLTQDSAGAVGPCGAALEIARAHYGEMSPEIRTYAREYGTALYRLGRYEEARDAFALQLAISRGSPAKDRELVQALYNMAIVTKALDSLDEAGRLYVEAIEILEVQEPRDLATLIRIQTSYASLLASSGRLTEALEYNERTLELTRSAMGEESFEVAWILNDTAAMLWMLGDLDKARDYLDECLRIQGAQPEQADFALRSRVNLAIVLREQRAYSAARAMFESARAVAQDRLAPDHSLWGQFHTNYADLLLRIGDYPEARRQLERGIAILETTVGEDHFDVAEALGQLGRLELREGAPGRARVDLERALAILDRSVGRYHPTSAATLDALAETYFAADAGILALETAVEAETLARRLQTATLAVLPERQALAHLRLPRRSRDLLLALALRPGAPAASRETAYDALIRSRALAFDEIVTRQRTLFASADPEVERGAIDLREAKRQLTSLFLRGPGDDPRRYERRLADARARVETLETDLARVSADFESRRRTRDFGLEDLRAALPRDSACVSYVQFRKPGTDPAASYVAVVLPAGGRPPEFVDLGSAEAIDIAIGSWREALEPSAVRDGGEASYRRVAEALRRRVWDPVAPLTADAAEVFVVPEGAIGLVSFVALPVGETGYLLEEAVMFDYLTAERDLASRESEQSGLGLVALANPAFERFGAPRIEDDGETFRGAGPSCSAQLPSRFESLPGAGVEVDAVRRIWKKAGAGEIVVLEGRNASETLFKREAPGAAVLHLATHGFFLDGARCGTDAAYRGISGISPRKSDAAPEHPFRDEINPLLLSGLALAGANRRDEASADADDGILTAEEVGALDLGGVELAVLSACRTGAGRVELGEGVFGLRRAFQVAGVQVVITNLWDVEDRAARAWIEAFYRERLLGKRSISQAVRTASLELLEARREAGLDGHPFYWAGWLAVGNPV